MWKVLLGSSRKAKLAIMSKTKFAIKNGYQMNVVYFLNITNCRIKIRDVARGRLEVLPNKYWRGVGGTPSPLPPPWLQVLYHFEVFRFLSKNYREYGSMSGYVPEDAYLCLAGSTILVRETSPCYVDQLCQAISKPNQAWWSYRMVTISTILLYKL